MPLVLDTTATTHVHADDATEQTVFTIDPSSTLYVIGIWLDFSNLTQNITIRLKYQIDDTNYRTFDSINWTTGMDDGVLIEGNMPIDGDFRLTLQSGTMEGASRNVPYEYITQGLGSDATSWTYTLTDSVSGLPIGNCEIKITTDATGNNVVASAYTDNNGQITVYLTSGTYYLWRFLAGYNFSNPDVEVV